MPNWCVGTLKVRGRNKDIKDFVYNGLLEITDDRTRVKNNLKFDELNFLSSNKEFCINGLRRAFVKNVFIELTSDDDYDKSIICLDAQFAWCIDANKLAELSKKYRLDFKVYGFESGMEFNQDVEIVRGNIVKDEVIEFKDYGWECIDPTLGG